MVWETPSGVESRRLPRLPSRSDVQEACRSLVTPFLLPRAYCDRDQRDQIVVAAEVPTRHQDLSVDPAGEHGTLQVLQRARIDSFNSPQGVVDRVDQRIDDRPGRDVAAQLV